MHAILIIIYFLFFRIGIYAKANDRDKNQCEIDPMKLIELVAVK